jgi:hypothetical protein
MESAENIKFPITGIYATAVYIMKLTCFIALVCAAEPTRDTDKPTLMAGRIPL